MLNPFRHLFCSSGVVVLSALALFKESGSGGSSTGDNTDANSGGEPESNADAHHAGKNDGEAAAGDNDIGGSADEDSTDEESAGHARKDGIDAGILIRSRDTETLNKSRTPWCKPGRL